MNDPEQGATSAELYGRDYLDYPYVDVEGVVSDIEVIPPRDVRAEAGAR